MHDSMIERVQNNPKFHALVATRSKFSWILTIAMLVIYYGFILLIAFSPATLGTPIGNGVTTLGIPVGIFVIVSAFILTGIYVRRANTEFDQLTREVVEDAKK
ncbi:DUF485 domain-containing protein [Chitinibacter fontanus]|uniref:DUF485 domain-containing protein n=1 Tax=Chitinibacter fontanus TaxID=1737446 RepID=A0A7D5V8M5_9NEIS|nr:DUF485 domain-containing protein [Chitinibacter fontanus]QLI80734.1 DUF485 domain-containing protein [Chitinibacter fontanus]